MEHAEDIEFRPPTAARVAARAFVLLAVAYRASMESAAGDPEAADAQREMLKWVQRVQDEIETREYDLLRAPLGTLERQAKIDASWQGEGAAVLAWALRRYELPAYDTSAEPSEVAERLGFLHEHDVPLRSSDLRPLEEIDECREKLFAVHWRLREFWRTGERVDFVRVAREAYFGPLDIGGLPLIDGDLAIDGKALPDVGNDRCLECLEIASERHRAANWLAGTEIAYSEVTADT